MSAASSARWVVPAAVTALVVGGGVAASAQSDGVPDLPERSAAELLVAVSEAEPTPFSGTFRTAADLGLPSLADLGAMTGDTEAGTGTDPLSVLSRLATGENSLRVWVGGPEQQRLSLVDDLSRLDLVRDGDVAWTYSSAEETATRYDLAAIRERAESAAAAHEAEHGTATEPAPAPDDLPGELAPYEDLTPDELARTLLAEADAHTEVTVAEAQVVAGRDAYTLRATPRDDVTLVEAVEVAVDAETGLVLQVRIDARGQADPAFVSGFTDLDLGAPDAEVFAFTPPAGTTVLDGVEELEAAGVEAGRDDRSGAEEPLDPELLREMFEGEDVPEPVVHGEGWSTVVELTLPDRTGTGTGTEDSAPTGEAADVLGGLTTDVEGGTVLSSALLTVLLTDDGRVLLGAVDAATLQSYAG